MRISKSSIYQVIILILILIVGILAYIILAEDSGNEDLIEFKNVFYENAICQYSCPLSQTEMLNRTVFILDLECSERCTEGFNAKNLTVGWFSPSELGEDRFFEDLEGAVDDCGRTNPGSNENETETEEYIGCIREGLEGLKEVYDYLE